MPVHMKHICPYCGLNESLSAETLLEAVKKMRDARFKHRAECNRKKPK